MAFVFMDPRRNLQARLKKGKKSKEAQEVLDRLDNYLEGNIAEPVRWLVRFWGDQAAVFTYKELRSIVTEASIPERIFNEWYQDYSRLIRGRMTSLWKESFLAASHSDPRLTSVGFDFDFTDRRVKNWILNRTGELITKVTGDQVEAVKYIIAESKMKHMGAAETARYIRPIVGLNQRQAAANLKYYDSMKEQLKKDHPRMKDESIEKKAREAAAKYAGKQQRERAHTIAETEMAMAYNHGMAESIRQAVNKGILPAMRKIWSTSKNGHVCEACEDMEGVEIDMDEEFTLDIHSKRNPDMVLRTMTCDEPPWHPRCHCGVLYVETDQWVEPESEYQEVNGNGLSAGDIDTTDIPEHDAPVLLETIDVADTKVVKSTLERYENDIVSKDVENAIVICEDGSVYQCFGTLNGVYPNVDLGQRLYGAYMTHNHPIGSVNEYSFSDDDISLYLKYNLKVLRGIDEQFVYQFSRNPLDIDSNVTIFELDKYSARHEKVIDIARNHGIGYRRWHRD